MRQVTACPMQHDLIHACSHPKSSRVSPTPLWMDLLIIACCTPDVKVPVVASKAGVAAVIDELEKLTPLLADAVKEEQGLVKSKAASDATARAEKATAAAVAAAAKAARDEAHAAAADAAAQAAADAEARLQDAVRKLVALGYFSTVRGARQS
jgi:hypothetical protein